MTIMQPGTQRGEQNSSQVGFPLPPIQQNYQRPQTITMAPPPPYAPPPATMGGMPPQHMPPYPPPYPQYHQNGAMPPGPVASQNGQMMRFPLPPQPSLDGRQMSGGRHKKEIKRRTKTGCITCRKRRIKCDEGHPTCRNCQKSKRECLGYDPIFKQQPGPAPIQPAPTGNPTSNSQPPHHHNSNNPYSNPQAYPGSYNPAAGPSSHGEQQQSHYEYGSSAPLDPALASGDPSLHMAQHNYPNALQAQRRVKAVAVQDLFSLNDIPPRYHSHEASPPPISPSGQQEVERLFKYHYALGLDRLLETTWYSQTGLVHLQRDAILQDFVYQCAEQFRAREDANNKSLQSLEARLVWLLAVMPRSAAAQDNGANSDPVLHEVLPRLDALEHLLTGQYLEPNRVPHPPQAPQHPEPGQDPSLGNQKYNEKSFWHHLARFVAIRDDSSGAQKDIDETLAILRNTLNMLENRDVLYSLAVARHIGGRMPDFHPQRHLLVSHNDSNDPINKLKVAHEFVESEELRGTSQVIQRVCSMATRAWILQK